MKSPRRTPFINHFAGFQSSSDFTLKEKEHQYFFLAVSPHKLQILWHAVQPWNSPVQLTVLWLAINSRFSRQSHRGTLPPPSHLPPWHLNRPPGESSEENIDDKESKGGCEKWTPRWKRVQRSLRDERIAGRLWPPLSDGARRSLSEHLQQPQTSVSNHLNYGNHLVSNDP